MERKVFRTYRSETTSSCEYFHLVVMVVLDVVVVVLVLVVRQAMRETYSSGRVREKLLMSETVARLLFADIKS